MGVLVAMRGRQKCTTPEHGIKIFILAVYGFDSKVKDIAARGEAERAPEEME